MRFPSIGRGATVAFALFALLAMGAPAVAQTALATITGTVRNSGGGPVAGASVKATGPGTVSAVTAADGTFTISVQPGIYTINVTKAGYLNASVPDIATLSGAPTNFAVTLNQASLESLRTIGSVTTQSRGTALNTGAAVSNFVPPAQFNELANPQINDALQRDPDVTIQHMGSQPDTTIIVGDVQPYETQVLIDGHPIALGQFGVFLSQYFPSYLIGGIETNAGPGNTTPFANLAVGGTANILTPGFTQKNQAELTTGIDNYQSQYSHVVGSGSLGKLQYVLGAGIDGANGPYFTKTECIVTPQNSALSNTAQSNAIIQTCGSGSGSFFNKGLIAKLNYNFSPVTSFEASFIGAWGGYNPQGTAWGLAQGEQTIVPCLANEVQCTNPNFSQYTGQTINALSWYTGSSVYNNQDIFDGQFRTSFAGTTLLVRPYIGSIEPEVILGTGQSSYPAFYGPVGVNPTYPAGTTPPPSYFAGLAAGTAGNAFEQACSNNYDNAVGPDGKVSVTAGQEECFGSQYTTFEQDKLYGTTFSLIRPFGNNLVDLTYDYHGQNTFAYINSPADVSVPLSSDRYSTFSLTGSFHLTPSLAMNAGLYNTNWNVIGYEPISLTNSNLTGFSRTITRFDPHIAFADRLDANTSLRAAYGTSTTFPYIGQVSGLATYQQPAQSLGPPYDLGGTLTEKNANLEPEVAISYDAGADHRFGNGSVLSGDFTYTVIHDVFETLTTSTINPLTGGLEGIFSPINVAQLQSKVLTLKYAYAPNRGIGYNIAGALASSIANGLPAAAYTAGEAGFPVNGVQICGNGVAAPGIPTCIPYLKGYAQVTYLNRNGLFTALGVDYEGKNNSYFQPPFALFDAELRKSLTHNADLQVSFENLLNTNNYGTYLSTPNAGTPLVAGTTNAAGQLEQTTFVPTRISAPPRTIHMQVQIHTGATPY